MVNKFILLTGIVLLILFSGFKYDYVTKFYNENIELAKQLEVDYNIPHSVTLTQAALESNYGRSNAAGTLNNYFGITNGKAKLNAYSSKKECFLHYARIITSNRYKTCLYSKDSKRILKCIHAKGYAEDPDYSNKLLNILNNYYDKS